MRTSNYRFTPILVAALIAACGSSADPADNDNNGVVDSTTEVTSQLTRNTSPNVSSAVA